MKTFKVVILCDSLWTKDRSVNEMNQRASLVKEAEDLWQCPQQPL